METDSESRSVYYYWMLAMLGVRGEGGIGSLIILKMADNKLYAVRENTFIYVQASPRKRLVYLARWGGD